MKKNEEVHRQMEDAYALMIPTIPAFGPWDLTVLPVTVMFFIQFKPHRSPIIKAIIFGSGAAFIGEPIFKWLDLYEPNHWKSIYSFPIYIFIYLASHFISTRKHYKELDE
ncbi:CBO0543 family protein [Bacillus sp. SA1-12]|uniref:CBO0543 family protein n=1 Tax=Bacillus sp. SA1-12 TaxID=1455638 RepID=UPI0006975BE2|nr:CBO0543 family protein [Bacillus sp. SA1-12]